MIFLSVFLPVWLLSYMVLAWVIAPLGANDEAGVAVRIASASLAAIAYGLARAEAYGGDE